MGNRKGDRTLTPRDSASKSADDFAPRPAVWRAEFREPFSGLLARRLLIIAEERGSKELPMLGLGRAAVFGGTDAEAPDDLLFEVTDGQNSHFGPALLSMQSVQHIE